MDKIIKDVIEKGMPVTDCVAKIGECPLVSTHDGHLYSKRLRQGDIKEFENVNFEELKTQLNHFNHSEDIGHTVDINRTEEGINVEQVCEMENNTQQINILYRALDAIVQLASEHESKQYAEQQINVLMGVFNTTIKLLGSNND